VNQDVKIGMMTLAALAVMPGAAHAKGPMNFSVGDVTMTGHIPDGYCLPTGQNRIAAELLAKGDRENETQVTLMRCDKQGKPDGMQYDYYLIKSPRAAMPPLARADFIAMMTKELALPQYQSGSSGKASLDDAADGLSDTLGMKVDLSGEIKPRGADGSCVYMGGEVTVSSAAATYPIAVGGCGTTVGGKMLFVYSYDDPAKRNAVAVQLMRARSIVDRLKAADGRAN